jgi:uncharacterized protein YuzE
MEQVKVFYDRTGNTLTVWFGDPQDEYVAEETGDEVILMKDRHGRVIGFEKLNFTAAPPEQLRISFETVSLRDKSLAEVSVAEKPAAKHGFSGEE